MKTSQSKKPSVLEKLLYYTKETFCPEKLIPITEDIYSEFINNSEIKDLFIFHADTKRDFYNYQHPNYYFAGNCNVNFSVDGEMKQQNVYFFNKSKGVVTFAPKDNQARVLLVHLFDEAEVFIHAENNIIIVVRYYSAEAKATLKTDSTCLAVQSYFETSGIVGCRKVEPNNSYNVREFQRQSG